MNLEVSKYLSKRIICLPSGYLNEKNLLIIGTGGHAVSVLDLVESTGKFNVLGFICNLKKGRFILRL